MEGELSEGRLRRSDTAADSSSVRGCRRRRAGGAGGGPDRLKLGTFVAARHFSRQPADMTGEAAAAARRAADSQDPSRSDRWRLRARAIMMGLGGGGRMLERWRKRCLLTVSKPSRHLWTLLSAPLNQR